LQTAHHNAIFFPTHGAFRNSVDGAILAVFHQLSFKYERKTQMKMKLLLGTAAGALLFVAGIAVAQQPANNIDARRHPHLAAAQQHVVEAWQATETARTDNHEQLGGHAEKALEHLQAADRELKEAAEFANSHHH
jgi:hypothetical protein